VVLPLYRAFGAVDELHRRLREVLMGAGVMFELIFVDDACPEGSGRAVAEIMTRDPRVFLLRNEANLGQREAIRRGLAASRGGTVVIMDADLQDEPENIPLLLAELRRGGAQAVFAGRRGDFQSRQRMWTSRLFKGLMARLTGVPADAGSFVILSRAMANAVLALPAKRPYMLALIGATGLPTRSIPVPRATRPWGRSAYSEWARMRFAIEGALTALQLRLPRWIPR